MDNTQSIQQELATNTLPKLLYTSRAISLLHELIKMVDEFESNQQTVTLLAKQDSSKRHTDYLSNLLLTKIVKFGRLAKLQAEKLLPEMTNLNDSAAISSTYIDQLILRSDENNSEKRTNIAQLLRTYEADLNKTPEIYHTRLTFAYNPAMSSPLSSPAFNENSDLLKQHGLVNPLNQATLLDNISFDIRQLLTYDDYRLYLLQYYFSVLRAGLSKDSDESKSVQSKDLTPFDLLFNPQLEINYSPQILAILHFEQYQQLKVLSSFVLTFKAEAHRLLNESGELVRQTDTRINGLRKTLNALKATQRSIESSLDTQIGAIKARRTYKKPLRGQEYQRRNTEIQAEINRLKRERAFIINNTRLLNNYDRIAKLYVNAETQFLNDLGDYLLVNKNKQSAQIADLRANIFQNDLTINENHHQFRTTEKKSSPHFREKPFEKQNERYTNYRKLWLDIIDSLFKGDQ